MEGIYKMSEDLDFKISNIIYLDVSEDIIMKRLEKRAKIEGRKDDSDPRIIENRIKEYKKQTLPVVEKWDKEGLVDHIKCDDLKPEEVLEKTLNLIKNNKKNV